MNWSQIQRRWEPLRGLLVSYWHELSEDDLARIDGSRDALNRILQERYGLNAAEAEAARRRNSISPRPGGNRAGLVRAYFTAPGRRTSFSKAQFTASAAAASRPSRSWST